MLSDCVITPIDCTFILGPTACGKSAYAMELALSSHGGRRGEIVSCDSIQVYRGLDIGTAKPSVEDRAPVPHHMIDVADPGESFSAARYRDMAMEIIRDIAGRGAYPIVCGGSGLYAHALLYDMDFAGQGADERSRAELEEMARTCGPEAVHARLREISPELASGIHPNNVKRVIRAIERASGEYKDFAGSLARNEELSPRIIILCMDRARLGERIDARVDAMMAAGLKDEVAGLLARGLTKNDIAMLGIGYKEMIDCLEGKLSDDEAAQLIKTHTRQFAKRQVTWLKKYDNLPETIHVEM